MNSDNRDYNYDGCIDLNRKEFRLYIDLIPERSRVIDLGCGNGTLLDILRREKKTVGTGIEISPSGVEICRQKGIDASEGRIDVKLPYADKEFDFAICNVTIQMVMYPEILLKEMKRIARHQIIGFPNFGFYKNRLDMFLNGRVPKPSMFGYKWYSTGHIHPLSIDDFHELVNDVGGMKIEKELYAGYENPVLKFVQSLNPNLLHILCVCLLSSEE